MKLLSPEWWSKCSSPQSKKLLFSHWVVSDSCDPMDCSPSGSSVHRIFQARVLEWVAISSPRGSSRPRDQTLVSCIAGGLFTWATRKSSPRVTGPLAASCVAFHMRSVSCSLWFLRPIVVVPQSVLRKEVCFCTFGNTIICSPSVNKGWQDTAKMYLQAGLERRRPFRVLVLLSLSRSTGILASLQLVARRPNLAHRCIFFSWSWGL